MRHDGEEGFSLIELLVAVIILGLAFTIIVGGIGAAVVAADGAEQRAASDTVIRSLADAVRSADYTDCASAGDYAAAVTAPPGYTARVVDVRFWDGGWVPVCPGTGDDGLQRVELETQPPDTRLHDRMFIVKRRP